MSRYRDPQLQVSENYLYLFILRPNTCKSVCLNTHFLPYKSVLSTNKTIIVALSVLGLILGTLGLTNMFRKVITSTLYFG